MRMLVGSKLERMLAAGHFTVTAEVGPPRGPDPAQVEKKAGILRGVADAYNVTDNQTAVVRRSYAETGTVSPSSRTCSVHGP